MLIEDEVSWNVHFKVRQLTNKSLNISFGSNEYLQSYDTIICMRDRKGRIFLDKNSWDASATTGKHRNDWLMEGIAETRKKIKLGIYKLTDLNENKQHEG